MYTVLITLPSGSYELEGHVQHTHRVERAFTARGRVTSVRASQLARVRIALSTPPQIPAGQVEWAEVEVGGKRIRFPDGANITAQGGPFPPVPWVRRGAPLASRLCRPAGVLNDWDGEPRRTHSPSSGTATSGSSRTCSRASTRNREGHGTPPPAPYRPVAVRGGNVAGLASVSRAVRAHAAHVALPVDVDPGVRPSGGPGALLALELARRSR